MGVFWGEFVKREPKANLAAMRELMGWLAAGKIKPRISGRYKLADTAAALNDMAAEEGCRREWSGRGRREITLVAVTRR